MPMRIVVATFAGLLAAAPVLAQDAPAPAAGEATDANLYVFRDYAEPTAWKPTVRIDGKKVAAIGQNEFTAVRIAPGPHRVTLGWPFLSGQSDAEVGIVVEPGRTLYLEIGGHVRYAGGYPDMRFVKGSGFGMRADGARAIAACCKFRKPQ